MASTPSQENGQSYPSIVSSLEDLLSINASFSTIYADPPWDYRNRSSRGAATNHYQTLTVREICKLPVSRLTHQDSHLHLWTTNGFLKEAFDVIEAWGFEYKSCFVWTKPNIGMGNYWRVSHEFLLFAKKGKLAFGRNDLRSWSEFKRSLHSQKPEQVRQLVEAASPGPYLELFGRIEVPNSDWTVFGNEVERRLF